MQKNRISTQKSVTESYKIRLLYDSIAEIVKSYNHGKPWKKLTFYF